MTEMEAANVTLCRGDCEANNLIVRFGNAFQFLCDSNLTKRLNESYSICVMMRSNECSTPTYYLLLWISRILTTNSKTHHIEHANHPGFVQCLQKLGCRYWKTSKDSKAALRHSPWTNTAGKRRKLKTVSATRHCNEKIYRFGRETLFVDNAKRCDNTGFIISICTMATLSTLNRGHLALILRDSDELFPFNVDSINKTKMKNNSTLCTY